MSYWPFHYDLCFCMLFFRCLCQRNSNSGRVEWRFYALSSHAPHTGAKSLLARCWVKRNFLWDIPVVVNKSNCVLCFGSGSRLMMDFSLEVQQSGYLEWISKNLPSSLGEAVCVALRVDRLWRNFLWTSPCQFSLTLWSYRFEGGRIKHCVVCTPTDVMITSQAADDDDEV